MVNEFNKPSKIQAAIPGNIADPDEYNQNIAGQSKDSILPIDIDGNFTDGDLGDENIVANGALVADIKMRDGALVKYYDALGAFLRSKDPTLFAPSQGLSIDVDSGTITITADQHAIDTQAAASTDDLDTINGGSTGQILVLSAVSDARKVVLKSGTGNISIGADRTLNSTTDLFVMQYDGSSWIPFVNRNTSGFRAYPSAVQTILNNTETVVAFGTEEYDLNSEFDSASTYRFTPTIPGTYSLTANVGLANSLDDGKFSTLYIRKNGSNTRAEYRVFSATPNIGPGLTVSTNEKMNGSTDYIEIKIQQNNNTNIDIDNTRTHFSGQLMLRL